MPSTVMLPEVTSWNRSINLMMVDLPEPVEPMMAQVLPASAVKLTWSSTFSAPCAYAKHTSLKAISAPGAADAASSPSRASAGAGSAIAGVVVSTSSMRSAATFARGSMIESMPIIKKPMMMTIE